MSSNPAYPINPVTGTTTPIYVPASASPKAVEIGKHYFWLQVKAAQAYFSDDGFFKQYFGVSLDRIKNIVVTSKIRLDVPALDDAALGVKHLRDLRPSVPVQLGLSPNLIKLVPATMTQADVSLDLLVDKENQLAKLAGLINTDSLFAPLALSPGALAVAKTISSLAQKTIQAFIPAAEQKPILQFSGTFNLAGGDVREGYYVIIGTRDTSAPLPAPAAKLEVQDGSLLIDGRPADRLSYVILELGVAEARTRDAGANTPWHRKLREAEDEARHAGQDPFATDESRRQTWDRVVGLLREARVLLAADAEYLPGEADKIYWSSCELCKTALFSTGTKLAGATREREPWTPDEAQSRAALGIPADLDLDRALDDYLDQVNWTRAHVPAGVL
ncbi:MAG: hypothetical protein RMN52_11630 [Anaerolineae bacterium]|nr:hypothetical protein [Candidatus Roseilinea sp.]MDW8450641.1 hypothetical protein [Anaerolineae bacterium]